jgi:hypothetical protein
MITTSLNPPLPSDDLATFNSKAFATLSALNPWATEANETAADVNADAASALNSKNAAAASASAAETSRLGALSAADVSATNAGAVAWVSGTTYSAGVKVVSPLTGRVFRRISTGAGATDPFNDSANWEDVIGGRRIRITSATTLQPRCLYELDSSGGAFNVTMPASFADQDWIDFVDVGLALGTNNVTILRNGNNIRRVAEDLVLDVSADSFRLTGRTTLGWIEQ